MSGKPNWLLFCLVVLSLIAHGVLIYRTDFFKVRMASTLELTLQDIPSQVEEHTLRPQVLPPCSRLITQIPHSLRRSILRNNSMPKISTEVLPDLPDVDTLPVSTWQPDKQVLNAEPVAKVEEVEKHLLPPVSQPVSRVKSSQGDELQSYLAMIQQSIKRHKRYPLLARRRQFEGRVAIRFTISPKGVIGGVEISKSSGHKILDKAAIKAVRLASPIPAPPVGLFSKDKMMELIIIFKLQ